MKCVKFQVMMASSKSDSFFLRFIAKKVQGCW